MEVEIVLSRMDVVIKNLKVDLTIEVIDFD